MAAATEAMVDSGPEVSKEAVAEPADITAMGVAELIKAATQAPAAAEPAAEAAMAIKPAAEAEA